MVRRIALGVCWLLMHGSLQAQSETSANDSFKIGTIQVGVMPAIDPCSFYGRRLGWLLPKTRTSFIYKHILLKPGMICCAQDLSDVKQALLTKYGFQKVWIHKRDNPKTVDLVIETKDAFPVTADINLNGRPFLTIVHNNMWGYKQTLTNYFYLFQRWGYGFQYKIPTHSTVYFLGANYYHEANSNENPGADAEGINDSVAYRFHHGDVWLGQTFHLGKMQKKSRSYWMYALLGSMRHFTQRPQVETATYSVYHNQQLILGKFGFVDDSVTPVQAICTLRHIESLASGGSLSLLYGYQMGAFNHRSYVGLQLIKNMISNAFGCLHLCCEAGGFLVQKNWGERMGKVTIHYVTPSIGPSHAMRQFISMDYVTGYGMTKERLLGVDRHDPESVAFHTKHTNNLYGISKPIATRWNINITSILHNPIVLPPICLAGMGFVECLMLYDADHALLNNGSLIDMYGFGIKVAHFMKPWPALQLFVAHSPFGHKQVLFNKKFFSSNIILGVKLFPAFKNSLEVKPKLVAYG